MKKLIILITAIIFLTNNSFGQNVDSLFNSFPKTSGWNKTMNIDTSITTPYNKNAIAQITFKKKDRLFEIFIFNKNVLKDSTFLNSEIDITTESSCRNFYTHSSYEITKFNTKTFYIVPSLCPKCNFNNDKSCIKLAKSYSLWRKKNIK